MILETKNYYSKDVLSNQLCLILISILFFQMHYEEEPLELVNKRTKLSSSSEPNIITIEISTEPQSKVMLSSSKPQKNNSTFTIENLIKRNDSKLQSAQ